MLTRLYCSGLTGQLFLWTSLSGLILPGLQVLNTFESIRVLGSQQLLGCSNE